MLFHMKYAEARWLLRLGLAGATLAAWANSFSGPFVYDDFPSIFLNPSLRGGWGRAAFLFPPANGGMTVAGRPVLNASLALNFALGGTAVWGYHVLNLAIHLGAALLLFGIVRRTLARRRGPEARGGRVPQAEFANLVAFGAALLWAVHPLQTESVTYVIQRAEALMGFFYLLTLYTFVRGCDSRHSRIWALGSVAACALGMATKEVMVSAPVLVLAYDRTFVSGSFREAWRRHYRMYLGLAATWVLLAALVVSTHGRGDGAFDPGAGWTQYTLTQLGAIVHYLRLAVWPRPLIFEYGAEWIANPWSVLPSAGVVAALAVGTVVAFWRAPRLGFLGLFFFAILAPSSLVPGSRQTLAEHRMYLALAPLAVLTAWGLIRALGRAGAGVIILVACGLVLATAARNRDYHDDAVLWGDTVRKRPGNPVARHNYAIALYQRGRLAEAAVQYEAALAVNPAYIKAHADLGATLLAMGQVNAGIAEYKRALELQPSYEDAHFSLAEALAATGSWDEAIAHYRSALKFVPADALAHLGLARVLAQSGELDAGMAEAAEAEKLDPENPAPPLELGKMLAQAGRMAEAAAQLELALRRDPHSEAAREILQSVRLYIASHPR